MRPAGIAGCSSRPTRYRDRGAVGHVRAGAADRRCGQHPGHCRRRDRRRRAALPPRLRSGAAGVQIGTAYLLCPEAATPLLHRARLAAGGADATVLTNVFTGRPARVLPEPAAARARPDDPMPRPTSRCRWARRRRCGPRRSSRATATSRRCGRDRPARWRARCRRRRSRSHLRTRRSRGSSRWPVDPSPLPRRSRFENNLRIGSWETSRCQDLRVRIGAFP